jgi:hypothetical protein
LALNTPAELLREVDVDAAVEEEDEEVRGGVGE